MAIDDDMVTAFADDGGNGVTTIDDLPADVLALVLRRLDGASLAALGCASSAFRDLASDPDAWRDLCLAQWPSVRDALPLLLLGDGGGGGDKGRSHYYRQLFADAFPFPSSPSTPPASSSTTTTTSPPAQRLPARLFSAVDLYHGGARIMSRVVETDAASGWFLGAPFRVDALVQEAFTAPSPITPSELTLSWVLIDPDSGRAVNASSRRPVSVERRWLTGETVVRFALVLSGGGGGEVMLDAAVTCDERYGHVREVSLSVEDGEGGGVSGRDGLAVVAAAMAGARRGHCGAEEAAAAAAKAKLRYEEFVRRRNARKERRTRRDGIIDLCCSGVGAAAFLGFLVMLTFR